MRKYYKELKSYYWMMSLKRAYVSDTRAHFFTASWLPQDQQEEANAKFCRCQILHHAWRWKGEHVSVSVVALHPDSARTGPDRTHLTCVPSN